MITSSLDASTTKNDPLFSVKNNLLDKNDFLKMLITQLEYQDPLNPMEGTEFTTQLAQFSSLEQLQQINNNFEKLDSYYESQSNSQAVNYIGKYVEAEGNSIYMLEGKSDDIYYSLESDAKSVFINIYDKYGRLARNVQIDGAQAGDRKFEWDGKDNSGNTVYEGLYTLEVFATNSSDEMINVETIMNGKVTGVTYENGEAYLLVDNRVIPVANVREVRHGED